MAKKFLLNLDNNRRKAESVFLVIVCFYMPVCSTYLSMVCVNETYACICVYVCVRSCVRGLNCK